MYFFYFNYILRNRCGTSVQTIPMINLTLVCLISYKWCSQHVSVTLFHEHRGYQRKQGVDGKYACTLVSSILSRFKLFLLLVENHVCIIIWSTGNFYLLQVSCRKSNSVILSTDSLTSSHCIPAQKRIAKTVSQIRACRNLYTFAAYCRLNRNIDLFKSHDFVL